MTQTPNRRSEPRIAVDTRALVVAPGLELACRVIDASSAGMKIRLERANALPRQVVVVEIGSGMAAEADVAWTKGQEAGLKVRARTALTGLAPSRLIAAKDAWRRATGR